MLLQGGINLMNGFAYNSVSELWQLGNLGTPDPIIPQFPLDTPGGLAFTTGYDLWTPAAEFGASVLTGWFDAQTRSTITKSSTGPGTVSTFADKGGDTNDATQGTDGNRPLLIDFNPRTRELPSLRENDTGDFLTLEASLISDSLAWLMDDSGGSGQMNFATAVAQLVLPYPIYGVFGLIYGTGVQTTQQNLWQNGTQLANAFDGDGSISVTTAGWAFMVACINSAGESSLGRFLSEDNPQRFWQRSAAGRGGDWEFCEIIAGTGTLTSTQRQKIEGYLAYRWKLQNRLPDAHPYKNTPPLGSRRRGSMGVIS